MSEKRKPWLKREVKIGLAVVAALSMLYFGINFLKGVNIFKPATYFYVQVPDGDYRLCDLVD